jgi:fatty acid desaturase
VGIQKKLMRNWRDIQSIAYLTLLPAIVVWQWRFGFSWCLYFVELCLTLGVGVIHHNHAHLRIWFSKSFNRVTDLWISVLQGHPTFVFYPAHIANHHRYSHGQKDLTRTYRFSAVAGSGDTNNLVGYLLHPFHAVTTLYPFFLSYLGKLFRLQRAYFFYCLLQYALVLNVWLALAILDPQKFLVLVLAPQLLGLHWLLATNYLQHAHADGRENRGKVNRFDYARNFYGLLNPLLFNIGFHTAHHEHSRAHWSTLRNLHKKYQDVIAPELQERSLLGYMFRVYGLGIFYPRFRTQSLHKMD